MQTRQDKLWELIEARSRCARAARQSFNVGDLCNAVHSKLQVFDYDCDIVALRKEIWRESAHHTIDAMAMQLVEDKPVKAVSVIPEPELPEPEKVWVIDGGNNS